MRAKAGTAPPRRVRWRLLVLLWILGLCTFVTIDLYRNVAEFDAVRPRARFYQAMRYAAHKMVDEPYHDGYFAEELPALARSRRRSVRLHDQALVSPTAAQLASELAAVREMEEAGRLSRLREMAKTAEDARVRIAALRAMARRFGPQVREALVETARDANETDKVRKQAARLIGRTGPEARADLDAILGSDLPAPVRAGAVLGLGELGTASAAKRVLAYAAGSPSPLRTAALSTVARMSGADAAPILLQAAGDRGRRVDTRTAACRALARHKGVAAMRTLSEVLEDSSNPPRIRAAAADSLGRLGEREALAVVAAASRDNDREVARQARIARTRLEHVKQR